MKKLFLSFLVFLYGGLWLTPIFAGCPSLVGSTQATATEYLRGCAGTTTAMNPSEPLKTRIAKIATNLIKLGSLLAVGAIVWAGIQYTKSFGDDEALKKAKSTAIYGIIGLLLLLFSFALAPMIIKFIDTIGAGV